ncbi:MAG TPA: GAF domain-containing protein [Longimicrobiales bacterium]|nr:GAF domain-containing protein [Longimicrobiales bacterium]
MVDAGKLIKRIQEMRDEGYLSDAILRESVKQLKAGDVDYNFVGVYLFNPDEQILWLHNYMGTSTEHARIEVGKGVCGTAVAEKKNQNVGDVTQIDNYLACSPKTKAELVVLIRAGDEIFGQIDIDARTKDAFTRGDQEAVEMIADKLAEVFMAERR